MHNICKTAISGEEQNLYKQMAEFRISILFQYFIYILAKFNTLRLWNPISHLSTFSIQYRVGTLSFLATSDVRVKHD